MTKKEKLVLRKTYCHLYASMEIAYAHYTKVDEELKSAGADATQKQKDIKRYAQESYIDAYEKLGIIENMLERLKDKLCNEFWQHYNDSNFLERYKNAMSSDERNALE